jgi:hypothetical protein
MRPLLDHEATYSVRHELRHEYAVLLRAGTVLPNDYNGKHLIKVGRRGGVREQTVAIGRSGWVYGPSKAYTHYTILSSKYLWPDCIV